MPRIALVVITKNEERCIARCLKSAAPYVEKMLVLDTGSTDQTISIARSLGAEVHEATWNNDFSQARNHALELADSDWNLVLDADEWIEDGGACLREIAARGVEHLGVAIVHNAFVLEGRSYCDSMQTARLLPRGVRYEGRIHELPVSHLQRALIPLTLGHDGYLPTQMHKKKSRNLELLKIEWKKNPNDSYINFQMGKEKELVSDYLAACDYYQRAFKALSGNTGYTHALVVGWLYCLGKSGQYAQALEYSDAWMQDWPQSPDFFFVLGNLLLDKAVDAPEGNPLHWLEMAKLAWERCLEIGEQPQLSNSVSGRGSYLAAFNLALAWEQLGEPEKAQQLRQSYPMP